MDTTLLDKDMEDNEEGSAEQLPVSCSFLNEIFGDPEVVPRVGYQYQAQVPPLVEDWRGLQVVKESLDSKDIVNVSNPIPMGLPIPIFWTKTEVERLNGAFEFENSQERCFTSCHGCAEYKVESLYSALGDQKDKEGYMELHPKTRSKMYVDLLFLQEPNSKVKRVDRGFCPLPDTSKEVWKDIECDGFLLGLYIFGKNLILVKDFVGSKEMGEILSFYYGKFYGSDGYRRWSECRKLRSKRCIHGQKLFTGWRQQELLSRLFSHLSKECQDMLSEVSKTFGEGKVFFEEYVFTIKNAVGLGMLIEAIGIGKGKRDLTTMELVKANHVVSSRPEIPIGKACSALTSADIIKFLTGDFRLSKARSSDLFWEAVWPRLLARGWHSEQAKDQVFAGLKNSLLFLIPGVKKFSRRRLVKGNHYFDSVTDVLNKVASEPGLLDLEIENKWEPVINQAPDFVVNKHNRYLKPRNFGCNRDLMKFMIVDTSLVQRDEQSKVRELRSLPLEATSLSHPTDTSSDSEEDTSDDSEDEAEETSTSNAVEAVVDGGECVDFSDCNLGFCDSYHCASDRIISLENHGSHDTSLLLDDEENVMKYNSRQKVPSSSSKYTTPLIRQQNSTDGQSSCGVGNIASYRMSNEEYSHCRFNQPDACQDMLFQTGSVNLLPATSLSKGNADEDEYSTKTQSHTLIDLNVPQVSIGFESDGPLITETVQNSDKCPHVLFFQSEIMVQPELLRHPDKVAEINQHTTMHNRRQSTRNRPLTIKALEALECGFFSPVRKRKAAGAPQNNWRRVRGRPVVSSLFRNGANNPNIEES
ncbi:hypothetical protein ERO13_A11G116100v2 [Gossypium hirsutum]|nr:hypothetical protein ERO13_A11G116100v2 [Gossypium hirsutum]